MKRSLKWISAAGGLTLFLVLVWRVGPSRLAQGIGDVGWGMALLVALGGASHGVKTAAWRLILPPTVRPPFLWMYGVRLAGEAVSMMTAFGHVFGETTRAVLVKRAVPLDKGLSSILLDRALFTLTGACVIVAGVVSAPWIVRVPNEMQRSHAVVAGVIGAFVALAVWIFAARRPFLSRPLGLLGRLGPIGRFARERRPAAERLESMMHGFCRRSPRAFGAAFALNLVGHALSVTEVFTALYFLGSAVTPGQAFVIEALTKVVNLLGAVVPGNLGGYEAGNILILQLVGLTAAVGLTLGVVRRLRGLCWGCVGLLVLFLHKRLAPTPVENGQKSQAVG